MKLVAGLCVVVVVLCAVQGSEARAAEPEPRYKQFPTQEAPAGKGARKFMFTYTAQIEKLPDGTKKLELWLPVPPSGVHQDISDVQFSVKPHEINVEPAYGNRLAYWKFEGAEVKPVEVVLTFACKRKEIALPDVSKAKALDETERAALKPFLEGNKLLLVGAPVKDVAAHAAGKAQAQHEISKAAYDYVLANMQYSKAGQGWGHGSTEWACQSKYGNCTDFHALFQSIVMTKGVPSKFEMGLPLPADKQEGAIGGYHCWAKFYLGGIGWVPVDISEASRDKEKFGTYYYGNLTADRVHFTTGRMFDFVPKQAGEPVNFLIYPYAEADGKSIATGKTFKFKDLQD